MKIILLKIRTNNANIFITLIDKDYVKFGECCDFGYYDLVA